MSLTFPKQSFVIQNFTWLLSFLGASALQSYAIEKLKNNHVQGSENHPKYKLYTTTKLCLKIGYSKLILTIRAIFHVIKISGVNLKLLYFHTFSI